MPYADFGELHYETFTLPHSRLGRAARFLNAISIVQLPGRSCRYPVASLEPLRNLEAPSLLIFALSRRLDLTLVDAIPIDQENLVHAIAVVHRRLGNGDRFFFLFAGDRCLHKKTGFETRLTILDDCLGLKRSRFLRHCGVDASDPALKQVCRK